MTIMEFERIDHTLLNTFNGIVKKLYRNKRAIFGYKSTDDINVYHYVKINKINGFRSTVDNWKNMELLPRQDKFEKKLNEIYEFLQDVKNDECFNNDYKFLIENIEDEIDAMRVIFIMTVE